MSYLANAFVAGLSLLQPPFCPIIASAMKWEYLPAIRAHLRPIAALCAAVLFSVLLFCGPPGGALAEPAGDAYDTTVREVVTLDREIADIDGRLSSLSRQSAGLGEQIRSAQAEVDAGREKLGVKRRALAQRARSIYVNGRASNIEMLFSSQDFSDFLSRTDLVGKVTAQDAKMIKSVRNESERIERSLAELERKNSEVEGLKKELSGKRSRLEKARAEKNEVLSRAGEERQAVEQRSTEIEARMRELNPPRAAEPVTGNPTGRFLTMMATAYCPLEPGLSYATASGMRAQRGVVAVDPRVIPLGTRVRVEGYGNAIAGDTGSAIKGMRIDVCFDTLEEMNAYGWRVVRVEILD